MKRRVRALIIVGDRILLIHRIKNGSEYWVFPGGGLQGDESDQMGLQREALEELGVQVQVDSLFTSLSHSIGAEKQSELFYHCKIVSGTLGTGQGPEFQPGTTYEGMYVLEWVSLVNLHTKNLLPTEVRDLLIKEYQ